MAWWYLYYSGHFIAKLLQTVNVECADEKPRLGPQLAAYD